MKKLLRNNMFVLFIFALIIILLCMVYLVKGRVAAFAWTASIFIVGPLGVLLTILLLISLLVGCIMKKKKRIRITHILASLILAFPILLLTGMVFIPYPDNAHRSDTVTLSRPIEGDAVFLGGKNYRTHAVWPSERYAYDILEEPYNTGNSDLQSYGIYGKNILAPIKGEIIETHNGEEDIAPNIEKFSSLLGNYIFMRIEESDTYLIFAHLKNNSIRVAKGDIVEVGTVIAQVGNSGTTSEPHLHIQHQKNRPCNSALIITSEGLPITFKD
jgi:hypothetical protein